MVADGNHQLIPLLNPTWVTLVFTDKFVKFVLRAAANKKTATTWIDVPVGKARNDDGPPPSLETRIIVKYKQGHYNTCLYRGFASAIHHLGEKTLASAIASKAPTTMELNGLAQLNQLCADVNNRFSVVKYMTHKKAGPLDVLNLPGREHPTVIIPLGSDGGVQHAITVVGDLVFDSTQNYALTLSQLSVDWCCDSEGGYLGVYKAVTFVPFGASTTLSK